jgi:hypothetical protein
MKTKVIIVFLMLTFIPGLSLVSYSHGDSGENLNRQEKREKRVKEQLKQKQATLDIIKSGQFVIQAREARNYWGERILLNRATNFVEINGPEAMVQLTYFYPFGWNGLGGITLTGEVKGFKIREGKSTKPIQVELRIAGLGIDSHQFISVTPDGQATIEIVGDWGGQITFVGEIIPIQEAEIIRGIPFIQ